MRISGLSAKALVLATSFLVIAILVGLVRLVPPLTEGGLPKSAAPHILATAPANRADYCQSTLSGVDCACFLNKADEVLNAPREPVQGMAYADRWDLARHQAIQSC